MWYGRALPWACDTPSFLPPFSGSGFVSLDVDEGVDVLEGVDGVGVKDGDSGPGFEGVGVVMCQLSAAVIVMWWTYGRYNIS